VLIFFLTSHPTHAQYIAHELGDLSAQEELSLIMIISSSTVSS
jgi:hypothetical protein